MAERLVNADRDTPMLLPVDLREWVPEDDLVHFVITAVESMYLPSMRINRRGSGSEQYPPWMMLMLLIYCYANGIISSRRSERATYRDVAVRYLTGDTHPDHDTICTFRRENAAVVKEAFVEVLRQAESQDAQDEVDGQKLPEEIARRERLREKMLEARRRLEERAQAETEELDSGEGGGDEKGPKDGGGGSKKEPKADKQINLTDADSGLMRKSKGSSYEQAYNAQAVVYADGSQLVLATDVLQTPRDANKLERAVKTVKDPRLVAKPSSFTHS